MFCNTLMLYLNYFCKGAPNITKISYPNWRPRMSEQIQWYDNDVFGTLPLAQHLRFCIIWTAIQILKLKIKNSFNLQRGRLAPFSETFFLKNFCTQWRKIKTCEHTKSVNPGSLRLTYSMSFPLGKWETVPMVPEQNIDKKSVITGQGNMYKNICTSEQTRRVISCLVFCLLLGSSLTTKSIRLQKIYKYTVLVLKAFDNSFRYNL
jgi:hypothetical protein